MKGPCSSCGSSDGNHTYAEGNSFCFVCKASTPAAPGSTPRPAAARRPKDLVDVEVQAIPKRGIGEDTAKKFGYGYGECHGKPCQVATYFDARGRPVAQKIRYAGKAFEVLGNAKAMGLYGQHLWRDGGKSVVVTEGELDALSVSQAWGDKWPVVSIPNGAGGAANAVRGALEWLEKFDKVVFCFDPDEEGQKALAECQPLLSPGKAYTMRLPEDVKDPNDLVKAGRSAEIIKAFWEAKQWRPDELVTADEVWQRLLKMDHTFGLPVPHAGLNWALMGLRPGEITTLVAGTGSGKSTTCREWAAALAMAGYRIGYVGLEEGVERTLMGLLSVATSRALHLEEAPNLTAPDVVAAYEKVREHITFYDAFGSLEPDVLIGKMRFMVKGEGCKVIFLDHLSLVTSGGELGADERRTIDRMMTRLVSLVNETKVHVVAVCHLSRKEGTPHEEGRPVTLADLRGSHGISQLSANVVSIERDQQGEGDEKDVSKVRVLKCRHTGRTGIAGELQYDVKTGRQTERLTQFDPSGPSAADPFA